MSISKISLFDIFGFLIPGVTFLYLLQYLLKSNHLLSPDLIIDFSEGKYYFLPLLFFGYFLGHLLSYFGKKLERHSVGERDPWMVFLNRGEHTLELNSLNEKCFKKTFFNETGEIDKSASGDFFDRVYYYLEHHGKLEKVNVLMSQYVFFRNRHRELEKGHGVYYRGHNKSSSLFRSIKSIALSVRKSVM